MTDAQEAAIVIPLALAAIVALMVHRFPWERLPPSHSSKWSRIGRAFTVRRQR